MALVFPLAADFFAGLPVSSCSLDLGEATQVSGRTAGGSVLTAGLGARLWQGTVNLTPMTARQAEAVRARLNVLREPGRTLLVTPYPVDRPAAGVTTGLTIAAISTNSREMRLSGGTLEPGDGLSFTYGTNPIRYAFHRVVANNGGLLEVTPNIRPGAAVGAAVHVVQPWFKALIVPGSVNAGTAQPGDLIAGISFDIQQTLR